eukprot:Skav215115  [mRNA]  locus=scaffold1893:303736:304440:- [translate_table: standard]
MKESTKPPALQVLRPAGYDVHGTRQPPERDVWIISDWSFKTDKPVVEDFMQKREEICPIILRRLRLKLDKLAATLSDFSLAREIGEMLILLSTKGPVQWSRLRELCTTLKIPLSSMVKMMADAEADASHSSDLANENAVGSVLPGKAWAKDDAQGRALAEKPPGPANRWWRGSWSLGYLKSFAWKCCDHWSWRGPCWKQQRPSSCHPRRATLGLHGGTLCKPTLAFAERNSCEG